MGFLFILKYPLEAADYLFHADGAEPFYWGFH